MTARDKILEVLDTIRPASQADGGGACEACPISMMTLEEGIERRLKSSVPGVVEVTAL